MPVVATFNAIRIELYFDEHPTPPCHARYAEFVAQIDMTTLDVVRGACHVLNCEWLGIGPCCVVRCCAKPGTLVGRMATPGESNDRDFSHRNSGAGDSWRPENSVGRRLCRSCRSATGDRPRKGFHLSAETGEF